MLLLEPMTTVRPVAPGTFGSVAAVDPCRRLAGLHDAADKPTAISNARVGKSIGYLPEYARAIPGTQKRKCPDADVQC
jgi:hypothetical protein